MRLITETTQYVESMTAKKFVTSKYSSQDEIEFEFATIDAKQVQVLKPALLVHPSSFSFLCWSAGRRTLF